MGEYNDFGEFISKKREEKELNLCELTYIATTLRAKTALNEGEM